MQKIILTIFAFLSIAYITLYCIFVDDLAAFHMDYQNDIPILLIVLSIIALIAMFIIKKYKPFDNKYFIIPLFFLISAIATLIIGVDTICEKCEFKMLY